MTPGLHLHMAGGWFTRADDVYTHTLGIAVLAPIDMETSTNLL